MLCYCNRERKVRFSPITGPRFWNIDPSFSAAQGQRCLTVITPSRWSWTFLLTRLASSLIGTWPASKRSPTYSQLASIFRDSHIPAAKPHIVSLSLSLDTNPTRDIVSKLNGCPKQRATAGLLIAQCLRRFGLFEVRVEDLFPRIIRERLQWSSYSTCSFVL